MVVFFWVVGGVTAVKQEVSRPGHAPPPKLRPLEGKASVSQLALKWLATSCTPTEPRQEVDHTHFLLSTILPPIPHHRANNANVANVFQTPARVFLKKLKQL